VFNFVCTVSAYLRFSCGPTVLAFVHITDTVAVCRLSFAVLATVSTYVNMKDLFLPVLSFHDTETLLKLNFAVLCGLILSALCVLVFRLDCP